MPYLPTTMKELKDRGISCCDFICVTGDAYVDHPSFGMAIISRVLEAAGFTVGVIAQPNFKNDSDYSRLGRPRYGFFVNSGNLDSMVSHYTSAKKKRGEDAYSLGGRAGLRPDRALTVYTKALKRIYPGSPVVIGGIEASLRRFAHYDYWSDSVMGSILIDSGADVLTYGMGERATRELALSLSKGIIPQDVAGTCVKADSPFGDDAAECASLEAVRKSKTEYAKSVNLQYKEQNPYGGKILYQRHGDTYLKQNPPQTPLTTREMDEVYALPYMRYYHPSYESAGGIPAIEEVEFSIAHVRGCFGACAFCALNFHQGRVISSRSHESVLEEARLIIKSPRFKGYIHDVGGPTANFRASSCEKAEKRGACPGKRCLSPKPCPSLRADHSDYLKLLRGLRGLPGVKKVFIRSGIRYDYLMRDSDGEFMRELVKHHISGQLKVAPEHISDGVLKLMGKPPAAVFEAFKEKYEKLSREYKKDQYLVPYLMSGHPGSRLQDAVRLAQYLKKNNMRPEQVQDFYPTPGTVSTCMFYTGINPETMERVYVPRSKEQKYLQRALLQYNRPQNHAAVRTALREAGRADLIGYAEHCLVPPDRRTAYGGPAGKSPQKGAPPNKKRKR